MIQLALKDTFEVYPFSGRNERVNAGLESGGVAGDAAERGVLGGLVPAIGEHRGASSGAAGDECVEPVPEVEEVLELGFRCERIRRSDPDNEHLVANLVSQHNTNPAGAVHSSRTADGSLALGAEATRRRPTTPQRTLSPRQLERWQPETLMFTGFCTITLIVHPHA